MATSGAALVERSEHSAEPSPGAPALPSAEPGSDARSSFRFYDNRQKYLMFVNTCTEKWAVAERVERE
ncbi:MAG TPA: hypothetical protein PK956_10285, partial [Burkholderiaceae bacterium]|nr:hypothetical protein [Burkholderiaceae bacterium]